MDAVGTLELSWAQGYDGGKASYIDKDVICYQCGNNIKFIAEDGAETVFNFKGNGVGPFAVHPSSKCFAIAERCLDPKICIYVYPTFRETSKLEGGAKLEYSSLVFSHSEYLASISGIPEFELTLWRYTSQERLANVKLDASPITSITFNPGNWRQLCITSEKSITVWNTEQSNDKYIIMPQKVKLPAEDPHMNDDDRDRDIPTRSSTRMTKYTVDMPKAAIAGIVGEKAERLDEIRDITPRVAPLSSAWAPSGDVYIGCKGGHVLRVDGEIYKAKVLYSPPPRAETPNSRATSAASRYNSTTDLPNTTKKHARIAEDVRAMILEGGADCVALHRKGLFVGGQDGILRLIDMRREEFSVLEQVTVGVPITSLAFSPSYRRIALGSANGSLHLYEAGAPESLRQLKDVHHGNFVGVGCLAGNEYCVSARDDGQIQVWTIDKGHLVASSSVGIQTTCLACSPMTHVAAVGTVSGHIYYVDLTFPQKPRVVHACRLYQGPVTHLVYDNDGKYLVSGSEDGHVFVIDGRASKEFKPIGFAVVPGEVQSISTQSTASCTKIAVSANNSGNKRNGADTLLYFEVNDDIIKDLRKHVHSLKYDFKDESVKKMVLKFALHSYGASLAEGKVIYSMGQLSKKINQTPLPEEPPKKSPEDQNLVDIDEDALVDYRSLMQNKAEPLFPEAEYLGHMLPGGKLQLSPHGKWLATCGTDGAVQLRAVGTMDRYIVVKPHDYHNGGVKLMAFSEDAQNIFTTGYDGVLTCYSWNFTSTGVGKAKSAMEAARARKTRLMQLQKDEDEVVRNLQEWTQPEASRPVSGEQHLTRQEKERIAMEKARDSDEIYTTPTPEPPSDATWLQVQELEAVKEEDAQYASMKKDLRVQIRDMRRTIQTMMKQNEVLPDIEKLGRHEFDLDIEEQNRLQAEADSEVARVREEIEFDNLAKMYLREMIKRECWDNMKVKGRAIQAFFSALEVSNFPMRERSAIYVKLLQKVTTRRKIEQAELLARRAEVESISRPPTTADDEGDNDEGEEGGKEKPSTTGSLGAMYGGGSDLYHSQFELHTREQKTNQIVLLEDAIFRIKNTFNKEFDEIYQKKLSEINKIKEKNKRIKKILDDLDFQEEVLEPQLSIYEKPEALLTVEDGEIKVERYLTAEQRKEKEKRDKEEAERRLKEMGDNARERGLDMMMGGVLEIKKEDELKKDIPKPPFMLTKEEKDWTEDEQKAVKEYERKVKELQEEREKYRKQLETELRKLQAQIQDGMQAFDEVLTQIFMKKIKVMMVIYQEELKILRLRYSLLVEEEFETREKELNRLLEHKKELKALSAHAMMESRKNLDAFKEQYDILNAEDKVMDRSFKREFNDVTAVQQDQLYRLFRKRPRIPRLKGFDTPAPPTASDSSLPNPFADRPSTARQHAQAKNQLDAAINDLDKDGNCPEGVEPHIWQRLCQYRREKIENDLLIKQKALVVAEMENFLKKRTDEDEQLKNEIEGIYDQLNKLQDDRQRFILNLELQLMLKQGQVEVEATQFIPDYKDSALIHRGVVEELNTNIKQLGESKINSMIESKDFRKGIIQLEWEQKRMLMQMEDLQNKMKDIQFMKVTREIQLYLSNDDYEGKKAEEIGKLEQTILTQLKHHEKNVRAKKKMLKELDRTIRGRTDENKSMDSDLTELNVQVNERRLINEVNADRRSDSGSEKRYQEIVQRRKLVDLAKAQAQEVAVLRAEVERLRMRTFPALVQVEH